jgi:aconitate hydratase
VTNHLASQLFAAHGAGWPAAGAPVRLRMGHVLLDERDGLVALLGFEALGRARVASDVALVAPAREADGPDARDDLAYLQAVACAIGALFVRPGAGPPAAVHRRGFAAPGRTLLAAMPGAAGAGAFGMLVLPGEPADAAAALAGEPLYTTRPRVAGVRLVGAPPAGVGGAEVLASLAGALAGAGRDALVEYHGEGVGSLPIAERVAMASLGGALLGARASLFPSDAVTRARLASRGRDADWRATSAGSEGFDLEIELDLGRVRSGAPDVSRVRIGSLAEDGDLRSLAAAARSGASLAGWEVVVGGRSARAALAAGDVLAALESAGAAVIDAGAPRALAPLEPGTSACGEDGEVLAGRARAVSVAALLHAMGAAPAGADAPVAAPLDGAEVLAPAPAGEVRAVEHGAAHPLPVLPLPLTGSPRGPVVWSSARDVAVEDVLAWGPRAQARRGDAAALAALAFQRGEGDTAVHAGGWSVVAGAGRWGDGGPHEPAARALAALGVRVVFAAAFAPEHARALAAQGLLPLRWRRTEDAASIAVGDELELPGISEGLARGGRVMVRDLTRGLAFDVLPAVDGEWLDLVRAGGLLASLARTPQEAGA